jgi:hypothetical protein
LTELNIGVKMRLVRIGRAVYDVVAIADNFGDGLWDELKRADPSDGGSTQMRGRLRENVPRDGPPRGKKRCRNIGDDIWEFKEWGVRVLWFYDAGDPKVRRRIVCTHTCAKVNDREFQQEKAKAVRIRRDYIALKTAGKLKEPELLKEDQKGGK